jgi:hypothetical protein
MGNKAMTHHMSDGGRTIHRIVTCVLVAGLVGNDDLSRFLGLLLEMIE